MDWTAIAHIVAPLAPKLGSLLGSAFPPFGGVVGSIAGNAIAGALGTASTPDAIADKIQSDPNAGERLAKLEAEHADALVAQAQVAIEGLKQQTEQQRIAAEGAANARNFSANLPTANAPLAAVQRRLAYLVMAFFFALLVLMLARPDTKVSEAMLLLLGVLVGMMKDISSFFFGSSAGSQAKDATIQTQAVQAAAAPATPLGKVLAKVAGRK